MIHFLGQFDPIWHTERYISDALEWWGEGVQGYDISSPFDRPGKNGNPPVRAGDVVLISQPQRFSGVSKRATGRPEQLEAWRRDGAKLVCWYFDWIQGIEFDGEPREATYLPALRLFDLVCSTDGFDGNWYARRDINRVWLPQAAPQDSLRVRHEQAPDYNVLFIGSCYTKDRRALLDALRPYGLSVVNGRGNSRVWGAEMARLCHSSPIVLGDNYRNDVPGYWSDRIYRVLGHGGFLLTPRVGGLSDYFVDGQSVVMYDGIEDCVDKVKFWLGKRHADRQMIGATGYKIVHQEHTYLHRARRLLELIDKLHNGVSVPVSAPAESDPSIEVKPQPLRVGLVGYTNTTSGIGMVCHDLNKWLKPDSILSAPIYKGQDVWSERQLSGRGSKLSRDAAVQYFKTYQPQVVIACETFFHPDFPAVAARHNCKTALIPMHESHAPGSVRIDLMLCPNRIALDKVGDVNKRLWSLPLDDEMFPFTPRKGQVRRFLHNFGYGYINNKRQTDRVIAGFRALQRQDVTLTISTQTARYLKLHGYPAHPDGRIRFRTDNLTPTDAYRDIDVVIQPEAYAGYGRVLVEAMAMGIPVITTDAEPMSEYVTDPTLRIKPTSSALLSAPPFSAVYNTVSSSSITAALERAMSFDLERKSQEARAMAEKHLWTQDKADELLAILGALCAE